MHIVIIQIQHSKSYKKQQKLGDKQKMVQTRSGNCYYNNLTVLKKRDGYKPETAKEQKNGYKQEEVVFDFNRTMFAFKGGQSVLKLGSYITEMVNWRDSEDLSDHMKLEKRKDEMEEMWSGFKKARKCEWLPSFKEIFIGYGQSNSSIFMKSYTMDFHQKDKQCKALEHVFKLHFHNGNAVGPREFFHSALLPLEFKTPEGNPFVLQFRLRELATFIFNGAFPEVQPQKFYYHVADLAKNNVVIETKHGQTRVKMVPDTFCFKFVPLKPAAPCDLTDE